ncbi:MAG: M1 family aminopeptidase [Chitinophagaceae bacterium]
MQHYRMDIRLTDDNDVIEGTALIHLKMLQPAKQFSLQLKNVAEGKGMRVANVTGSQVQSFAHTGDSLQIQLKELSVLDSVYHFTIQYSGVPADGLIIAKNKWGDRTFFSDNWPNRAHNWLPCNDTPADKATVEFAVTAPVHYQVVSNGVQVEESNVAGNFKRTHWRETVPIPTKVMVIGAARFAVKNYWDSSRIHDVSAWVYPQDSSKGFYDYALAPSILRFFHDYVGAYAFEKLANVQSKTMFGGMENASAIFYNETSVTGTRSSEGLIAHEIAHQWFGNMATEKSFAHLWLSEGFASYLTHIYLEAKYGTDTLMKGMRQDRNQIIRFSKNWNKPVVDSTSDLMDLLNANSYQKGSWVLHMLRSEVGDDVFRNIISNYYERYKGRNAETREFQQVAEQVSGKNLNAFFQQWLFTPGHPQLQVTWKQFKDGITVTIKQLQPKTFVFPFSIGVQTADKAMRLKEWQITKKEETFILKGFTGVQQIVLDPHTQLLFEGKVSKGK